MLRGEGARALPPNCYMARLQGLTCMEMTGGIPHGSRLSALPLVQSVVKGVGINVVEGVGRGPGRHSPMSR